MRPGTERAAVDFGHAETRAGRRNNDVGGSADANTAAEHVSMRRGDHWFLRTMDCPKRLVIAGVDLDDALGMLCQLLDVDPGAESAPLGANDDDADRLVGRQPVDVPRQGPPAGAVQGVHRRPLDPQLSHAILDRAPKAVTHPAPPLAR